MFCTRSFSRLSSCCGLDFACASNVSAPFELILPRAMPKLSRLRLSLATDNNFQQQHKDNEDFSGKNHEFFYVSTWLFTYRKFVYHAGCLRLPWIFSAFHLDLFLLISPFVRVVLHSDPGHLLGSSLPRISAAKGTSGEERKYVSN